MLVTTEKLTNMNRQSLSTLQKIDWGLDIGSALKLPLLTKHDEI